MLYDMTPVQLMAATVAWVRSGESKFGKWPTPGALIAQVPRPDDVDDADVAWGAVLEHIRTKGVIYREPGENPLIAMGLEAPQREAVAAGVLACGGWRALGQMPQNDVTAQRASFRAAYRGALESTRRELQLETQMGVAKQLTSNVRLLQG